MPSMDITVARGFISVNPWTHNHLLLTWRVGRVLLLIAPPPPFAGTSCGPPTDVTHNNATKPCRWASRRPVIRTQSNGVSNDDGTCALLEERSEIPKHVKKWLQMFHRHSRWPPSCTSFGGPQIPTKTNLFQIEERPWFWTPTPSELASIMAHEIIWTDALRVASVPLCKRSLPKLSWQKTPPPCAPTLLPC